ncbi:MAG TPA: sugar-binding domain-containing protein, partial [Chroococcales cyanobacterium]
MKEKMSISLDGSWDFLANEAAKPEDLKGKDWGKIEVPSNWHLAGLADFDGAIWFRRSFEVGEIPGDRLAILSFDGVDYFADVWLNEDYLGHHEGYFDPFRFECPALLEGKNELLVRVNSPREQAGDWPYRKQLIKGIFNHHDCRPGAWHPAFGQDGNTGGIWNKVKINFVRTPYVKKVQTLINVQKDAATVVARIDLGARKKTISSVSVVCRDPEGRVVAEASRKGPFSGESFSSFSIA